jgi:hypothetical protein
MGIIPAQIKYNLHQMNKEIIHQAAQTHAEKSFIQPEQGECLYLLGILFRTATKAHKLAEKHFKTRVLWYQEQQQTSCKTFD